MDKDSDLFIDGLVLSCVTHEKNRTKTLFINLNKLTNKRNDQITK